MTVYKLDTDDVQMNMLQKNYDIFIKIIVKI